MSVEHELMHAFTSGLDGQARVRARRPGRIYQIELPAYLADGDVAEVYVRTAPSGRMIVTDLGTTRMRLSYDREITPDIDSHLATFAESQGFNLKQGELQAEVGKGELLAAALGLIQIEAQADRMLAGVRKRQRDAVQFREAVLGLLRELFGDDRLSPDFHDGVADPDRLYAIDALVKGPRPLAIATVPSDLAAERAVIAKAHLEGLVSPSTWWLAIPKDLGRLSSKTQMRLSKAYQPVGYAFADDRAEVASTLKKYAA